LPLQPLLLRLLLPLLLLLPLCPPLPFKFQVTDHYHCLPFGPRLSIPPSAPPLPAPRLLAVLGRGVLPAPCPGRGGAASQHHGHTIPLFPLLPSLSLLDLPASPTVPTGHCPGGRGFSLSLPSLKGDSGTLRGGVGAPEAAPGRRARVLQPAVQLPERTPPSPPQTEDQADPRDTRRAWRGLLPVLRFPGVYLLVCERGILRAGAFFLGGITSLLVDSGFLLRGTYR